MLLILAFLVLAWPLIVQAITTDESGFYLETAPVATIALTPGGYEASTTPPQGLKLAPKPPSQTIQAKIAAAFPDAPIMYWVALNESDLDPTQWNPSGAKGLFEITGQTWRNYGCTGNIFNADDNIACAVKIHNARGLKDWEESRYKGFDGGWGKHL